MKSYLIWIVGIAIFALIHLLPKTNTRIGQVLRESDHDAWRYTVEDKEQELAELRNAEPRR